MNHEEKIEILEELLKSIKVRGYKKTFQLVKVEDLNDFQLTDPFAINVIQTVSDEFNVLVEDMVSNRYIRGDYKYAIGFTVHYLYQNMTLGEIHKKVFRNKTKTLLSRYRQIILDLDKSEKLNKKYIEVKERLDQKLQTENNQ